MLTDLIIIALLLILIVLIPGSFPRRSGTIRPKNPDLRPLGNPGGYSRPPAPPMPRPRIPPPPPPKKIPEILVRIRKEDPHGT